MVALCEAASDVWLMVAIDALTVSAASAAAKAGAVPGAHVGGYVFHG